MPSKLIAVVLAVLIFAVAPVVVTAQGVGGRGNRIEGNFKFLPIPYINYNRSIGLVGGAAPVLMFNPVKSDTVSPSSIATVAGLYSTEKTWFVMGFARTYLDRDNWRASVAAGKGNYNFQFYIDAPIDGWIPYSTDMGLAFVQVQRRIVRDLYFGLSYVYLDFGTSFDILPDTVSVAALESTQKGAGFSLALDKRSSVYYPYQGFDTAIKYRVYPELLGNEATSSKLRLEHNHFIPVRHDTDVLAARFVAGLGLGGLTFNQQFVIGQGKDIPGYTQGEYRGDHMLALSAEYRWNFMPRLGAIGTAALATVFEAVNEDDDGKPLPSVGAGFRITVDQETHLNVGIDAAVGLDDWGIYFRIGETF